MPQIPSLPLPWRDAKVLIEALHGQGVEVPDRWVGGTNNNEKWFTGSKGSDRAPIVELRNRNDENEKQQIWNLHGLIRGVENPKQKIIVGSHHDSWCFGSVDPGSASAILMEVVSIFSQLRTAQWQPLRSIQFVSWDASEFNLIGSTEFVEDQLDSLRDHGVAYINVDVGVFGQDFHAAASPVWRRALNRVMGRVSDPATNETIRKLWNTGNKELDSIGGVDGDYVAFQDIAGMSSIDLGFKGPRHGYPRHSCYETFEWMQTFGDPNFEYHRRLAEIWALLILEVADRPILPFDLPHYADEIKDYISRLQEDAINFYSEQHPNTNAVARRLKEREGFDIGPLESAAANLTRNVRTFHEFEDRWAQQVHSSVGAFGSNRWSSESNKDFLERIQYNDKLVHFEADLLDLPDGDDDKSQHGIPGREQFKHVIFGPGAWGGRKEFPAVRDAMEKGDWEAAQEMVEKAARIIKSFCGMRVPFPITSIVPLLAGSYLRLVFLSPLRL